MGGEEFVPNQLADRLTSNPGIVEDVMRTQMGDKPTIEQLSRLVGQEGTGADDLVRQLDANYQPLGGLGDLQQPLNVANESDKQILSRILEELQADPAMASSFGITDLANQLHPRLR